MQPIRNVDVVLDLGAARYITFGRPPRVYRVEPVAFQLGQRLAELQIQITGHLASLALNGKSKKESNAYYVALATVARLLWPALRPTKRWRRVFKFCHVLKNPCRTASEKELMDLVGFFLQCRMMSSVQPTEGMDLPPQQRTH